VPAGPPHRRSGATTDMNMFRRLGPFDLGDQSEQGKGACQCSDQTWRTGSLSGQHTGTTIYFDG